MAVVVTERVRPVGPTESYIKDTLILRNGEVVAVLPEGDPLLYLLRLPARRLQTMRKRLAPVLEKRHFERRVFDAILEYAEGRIARRAAGMLPS
jgi:hypothetical protein